MEVKDIYVGQRLWCDLLHKPAEGSTTDELKWKRLGIRGKVIVRDIPAETQLCEDGFYRLRVMRFFTPLTLHMVRPELLHLREDGK